MKPTYDAIYLSPHLDDAALSCGGQIYQETAAGRTVLVVTIMSGEPPGEPPSDFARLLHHRWQLAGDVVAARRAEDAAACRRLGADLLHLDLLDAIYRRHPATGEALYASVDELFGQVDAAEEGLAGALADRLAGLPPGGRVVAPLTIGQHVDHQLTRLAAERWLGGALYYYEDYPYAQRGGAVAEIVDPAAGWRAHPIPLSPAALEAKYDAITCFQSQLSSFFANRADLERQVGGYARRVGGERLWLRPVPV